MHLPLFLDFLVPVTIPCGLYKIRLSAPLTVGLVLGRAVRCCRISTQHASYVFLSLSLCLQYLSVLGAALPGISGAGGKHQHHTMYFQRGLASRSCVKEFWSGRRLGAL